MGKIIHTLVVIFSISAIRYFVLAGIPFFIFYKILNKWYSQSKIQNRNAAISDFKREIFQSIQTTAVLAVIGYVVLYTPFKNYTLVYPHTTKQVWS